MIKIRDFKLIYPKKSIIFPDIEIKENEFVGISGESGCGKTSLLNSICVPYYVEFGTYREFSFNGEDLIMMDFDRHNIISYCPQFAQDALNPKLTISKQIDLVIKNNTISTSEEVEDKMFKLKLPKSILNQYPYMLSGGQKQKVALLLSIVKKPKVLVLDEPSSGIDLITLKTIVEFLEEFKGKMTIIIVSHNKKLLNKLCDKVIEFEGGKNCDKDK